MTETPTPAVGQIWQDNDSRSDGRQLRIVKVDGTHATVEPAFPRGTGRRTRIRLDRFRPTSTGYRYLSGGEQQ